MRRADLMTCFRAVVLVALLPGVGWAARSAEFLTRTYTEAESGSTLPYRLFKPLGYDPETEYPLVLFLHGSGESGTNNTSQINGNIDNLIAHLKMPEYGAFLLAPQTNSGWAWGGDSPSDAIRMTMSVIEQLKQEFSIDSRRLYVTGLSMGGGGTWEVICQHPGVFAAAAPICGWGDTSKASLLVDQPIWAFHDTNDPTVYVQYSREMIAAVEAAGGHPLYSEYPSGGHNAWARAYNESSLYEWMFSQVMVPEPSAMILLAGGLAGLFVLTRRRTR